MGQLGHLALGSRSWGQPAWRVCGWGCLGALWLHGRRMDSRRTASGRGLGAVDGAGRNCSRAPRARRWLGLGDRVLPGGAASRHVSAGGRGLRGDSRRGFRRVYGAGLCGPELFRQRPGGAQARLVDPLGLGRRVGVGPGRRRGQHRGTASVERGTCRPALGRLPSQIGGDRILPSLSHRRVCSPRLHGPRSLSIVSGRAMDWGS